MSQTVQTNASERTLPKLQERLNFNGSDEQFQKYLNISLSNRGTEWREVFEMYYGINRPRVHPKRILRELNLTVYSLTHIRKIVLNLTEKEIAELIKKEKDENSYELQTEQEKGTSYEPEIDTQN